MTRQEAMKIEDLNIEVTPLVEDAFYAFMDIDCNELDKRLEAAPDMYGSGDIITDRLLDKYLKDIEMSGKALERWKACKDKEAKKEALSTALLMIENKKKYGYPCLAWWPE